MSEVNRQRGRRKNGDPDSKQTEAPSPRDMDDLFETLIVEAVERGADSDLVTKALDKGTDAAADVLAAKLRANAPQMLREHRKFRLGFERRLRQRWGAALDIYESVLVCCLESGEDFHKRYEQQNDNTDPKHHALTLLHARACLVASEIQSLLRSGHASGAQARWRTLHELAVIAFALGTNDPGISERFLLHRQVERYGDATHYQKHCQAIGYEPYNDEQIAEFQREHDQVVDRFGGPFKNDWGWAAPLFPNNTQASFAKLAELVGLDHLKPWFRLSSHGIHSGATGTMHVWEFYGRGEVVLAGPSNDGLADPGSGALISLLQVTSALLIYGGTGGPKPQDLVCLKAITRLLDQAKDAFFEIHHALEAEEAAIRGKSSASEEQSSELPSGPSHFVA